MQVADDMQQLQVLHNSVNAREKDGARHSELSILMVQGKKTFLFSVQMLQKPSLWTVCGGGERTPLQCS